VKPTYYVSIINHFSSPTFETEDYRVIADMLIKFGTKKLHAVHLNTCAVFPLSVIMTRGTARKFGMEINLFGSAFGCLQPQQLADESK
jgi:hypothetical protein